MYLPPVIEAESWSAAWAALRARVLSMTCETASRIVAAWTVAASETAWPLWYQFGALAYGWDADADVLDTSAAQAARPYPLAAELWESLAELVARLDADGPARAVYLQFDLGVARWADPMWLELVRGALVEDGARPALLDGVAREQAAPAVRSPDTDGMWLLALVVGAVWLMNAPRRSRSR